MKKLILLALVALMMIGCGRTVNDDTELCEERYHVIVLDSCEYLSNDRSWDLTHRGRCRFCEERDSIKWEKRKKELEEIVERLKRK